MLLGAETGWRCLRSKHLRPHRLLGTFLDRYFGKPVMTVGLGAVYDSEKFMLQRQGHRPGFAAIDLDLVYGADGCYLRSGAAEEHFFSHVEHFTGNHLFDRRHADVG